MRTMNVDQLKCRPTEMFEMIDPQPMESWRGPVFDRIHIETEEIRSPDSQLSFGHIPEHIDPHGRMG
jgi:hypothetical protein